MIRFILTGDSSKLRREAKAGEKSLADLRKEFREGVNTAAKWGAGIAAAGAAIGIHLVNQARQAIDDQAKLASSLTTTSSSLAVMRRAGELSGVGMDKVAQATKDFTRRLSQAAGGVGPAKDALDRLNLSAEALSLMPLDERVAKINGAINEFIPAAERAAVAGQLFGEEGSIAMSRISPDTIKQAAGEVDALGLALSEVDAAKVEQANDSFSRISSGVDGLVQQMTVEFAPIISALGDLFFDTAQEAGGLEKKGKDAAGAIVNGAALAMDGLHGIKTTGLAAGKGILIVFQGAALGIVKAINTIAEGWTNLANLIPGVNVDFDQTFLGRLERGITDNLMATVDSLQDNLMEPLPGTAFKQWVADAKAASQEAAEATVEARRQMSEQGPQIGGGAALKKLQEDLKTRIEVIRQSHLAELEALAEKKAAELEIIKQGLANEVLTKEESMSLIEQIEKDHSDKLSAIEKKGADERKRIKEAEARAKQQIVSNSLSDLSTLMNTGSRKLFEIGKAAAISSSILSTYEGIAAAMKLTWPLNFLAAAATAAKGFATVASIRNQTFGAGGSTATGSNTTAVNADATGVNAGAAGGGGNQTLTVEGLEPDQLFSGRVVRQLGERLRDHQADGGSVVFSE